MQTVLLHKHRYPAVHAEITLGNFIVEIDARHAVIATDLIYHLNRKRWYFLNIHDKISSSVSFKEVVSVIVKVQ